MACSAEAAAVLFHDEIGGVVGVETVATTAAHFAVKKAYSFGVCRRVIEPAYPAFGDSRAKLTSQYSNRLPTKMKKTKTRTGSD